MQTNKLTEELLVKTIAHSATTTGEVVHIYKPAFKIWASKTSQRGSMNYQENFGKNYSDTLSFYMRYRALDTKKIVIEYQEKDYEIVSIENVAREATIIECRAIQ